MDSGVVCAPEPDSYRQIAGPVTRGGTSRPPFLGTLKFEKAHGKVAKCLMKSHSERGVLQSVSKLM